MRRDTAVTWPMCHTTYFWIIAPRPVISQPGHSSVTVLPDGPKWVTLTGTGSTSTRPRILTIWDTVGVMSTTSRGGMCSVVTWMWWGVQSLQGQRQGQGLHLQGQGQGLNQQPLRTCKLQHKCYRHNWTTSIYNGAWVPRAGSGVVRRDPLRFLTWCRTRWLNQSLSLLFLS